MRLPSPAPDAPLTTWAPPRGAPVLVEGSVEVDSPVPSAPLAGVQVESRDGGALLTPPRQTDRAGLRELAAWAAEWLPDGRARLASAWVAGGSSRRRRGGGDSASGASLSLTRRRLGVESGFLAEPLEPGRLVLPSVAQEEVSAAVTAQLLTMWHAVVSSGGAVGFRRDARSGDIHPVLEEAMGRVADGTSLLVTQRDAAGELVGFGFWDLGRSPLFTHTARLARFQVRPDRQGHNLGRVLLAGMHRIIRAHGGVDLLELDYRSGTGLGAFYARAGYVEVGRRPGAIRLRPGDDRDAVTLMRRVDGAPLTGTATSDD